VRLQLAAPPAAPSVRQRLGAAACLLLAGSVPAAAQTPIAPGWQLEATGLLYGEQSRAIVVEPTGRLTRTYANGRALSMGLAVDAITGASPTGGMPSGQVQTTTTASGRTTTTTANAVPTHPFQDLRGAVDLGWTEPLGSLVSASTSAHYSQEKDYASLGGGLKTSVDLLSRLVTLTVGGSYNHDRVFPTGGTAVGLAPDTAARLPGDNPKDVQTGLVGLSRVMSRRWLLGVTGSQTRENGYLTDPYKFVSLVDPTTQLPVAQITEKRPSTRTRRDVLGSSVYHFESDIFYMNYRYYWDDWGLRSNTLDLKVRHDLSVDSWVQPHVRLYAQSPAEFFVFGLTQGQPLPQYASADERLGPLRTATFGATYGFRMPGSRGQFTVRAEYIYQWLVGRPPTATAPSTGSGGGGGDGVRPAIAAEDDGSQPGGGHLGTNIGALLVGYTVPF
jgi:hypothetical protein